MNWPVILSTIIVFLLSQFFLDNFLGSERYLRTLRQHPNNEVTITEVVWKDDTVSIQGAIERAHCRLISVEQPLENAFYGIKINGEGRKKSTYVDVPEKDRLDTAPFGSIAPFGPFVLDIDEDTEAVSVIARYNCWNMIRPRVSIVIFTVYK